MTEAAYKLMIERLLEDSFLPRTNNPFLGEPVNRDLKIAEEQNREAKEDCALHFKERFQIDSTEYCIAHELPF